MSLTFTYDGEDFPLCTDADKWLMGELRAVRKWLGTPMEEMNELEQISAAIAISIKRVRPAFKMSAVDDLPMGDLTEILAQFGAEGDVAEVPTVPAVEGGAGGSAAG